MSKDLDFTELMTAFSDYAEAGKKASFLGYEYTRKYSPYKKGDKIIIADGFNKKYFGTIIQVSFDNHSKLEGLGNLLIQPYTKDFKKVNERDLPFWVKSKEIILEHYPQTT